VHSAEFVHTLTFTTTYLEMFSRPSDLDVTPPTPDLEIRFVESPTVELYRHLYNTAGQDWLWYMRRQMSDEELGAIIFNKLDEIYLLYADSELAGYVEIDRRYPPDIEIAYLGIFPKFINKGLGKYLLNWSIDRAWSYNPKRVWIHTCTLDSPVALEMYKKSGFKVYKAEEETISFPHGIGFD